MAGLKASSFSRHADYHDYVLMCSTISHVSDITKTNLGCDTYKPFGCAQIRARRQTCQQASQASSRRPLDLLANLRLAIVLELACVGQSRWSTDTVRRCQATVGLAPLSLD
jgi:hypothetical protein